MPRVPVRQWVWPVPKRLRHFVQNDPAVQTQALHLFLSAVEEQGLVRGAASVPRWPSRPRAYSTARPAHTTRSPPFQVGLD